MTGGFRRWRSRVMVALLILATVLAVLPLFLILGTVIIKGAGSINLDFFIRRPLSFLKPEFAYAKYAKGCSSAGFCIFRIWIRRS